MLHIHTKTLGFQLLLMYIITISIPLILMTGIAPSYYQNIISNRTEILTESLIKSTDANLEGYLDDMERLTQTPYFDNDAISALNCLSGRFGKTTPIEQYQANRTITNLIQNYFQNTEEHIAGIILISVNGNSYSWSSYGSSDLNPDFNGSKADWYQKALAANGQPVYISTHRQTYLQHPDADAVFSVARLIRDPVTLTPLAVIMADASISVIEGMLQNAKYDINSIVAILNESGSVIYSTEALPGNIKAQAFENTKVVSFKNGRYKVVAKNLLKSNWKVVVMFSLSDINGKVTLLYVAGGIFALLGLLLTLVVFWQYSRHITTPYRRMAATMDEVKRGNLKARCEVKGDNEIARLGRDFNNMLTRIDTLVDEEYRAKLDLRNAEYRALQSQIRPHFLFNTLNGFIALNRLNDRQTLEKSIFSLTRLMRYTLEHSDWVAARDEFQFLENYCQLQQLRFENRLNYTIRYAKDMAELELPKLILQPLVENSIIHGIEPSDKMCHLEVIGEVSAEQGEQTIRIQVNDDGIGFDMNREAKKSSKGIGNIKERLRIAYGERAAFLMQSRPNAGTRVTITIHGQQEESK